MIIAVRMHMPVEMAANLADLMPRFDDRLRERVLDQLWLKTVLTEQRRRVNIAERPAYDERCDKILELLDPREGE